MRCGRCTRWQLDIPYPFLGAAGYESCIAGNRTRFLAHMYVVPFVYVLAMYMAIQTTLFLYASERSTGSVMDSDDSLSYTVHSVT